MATLESLQPLASASPEGRLPDATVCVSVASPASRAAGRPHQRRFGRTRTGCLTCRARRKKCDERRPKCLSCERNKLDCSFPLPKPRSPISRSRSPASPASPRTSAIPSCLRDEGEHEHEQATAALEASPDTQSTTLVPKRPIHEATATAAAASPFGMGTYTPHLVSSVSLHPILRDNSAATLFYHFCDRSSRILSSVQGHANPFLKLMVPIAMSNELVLEAILALSGIHYRNLSLAPTFDAETWRFLGGALRKLRKSLELGFASKHNDLLPSLMASVVLCVLETVRGDCNGVVASHLVAIRQLVETYHAMPGHDAEFCAFVLEYYNYSASLSRTTGLDRKFSILGIEENDVTDGAGSIHGRDFDGSGALCGCAYGLFHDIRAAMATIRQASLERERLGRVLGSTRSHLVSHRTRIQNWRPEMQNGPPEFVTSGQIYQEATAMALESALVYHGTLDEENMTTRANGTCATRLIDASRFTSLLSKLTISSPSVQTLCWPLAVAGCCTTDPSHRAVIADTLREMYRQLGIKNYQNVLDWLLKVVWLARDAGQPNEAVDVDRLFRSLWSKHGFA